MTKTIINREGKCYHCFGSAKSVYEEYISILLSDLSIEFIRQYRLGRFYFDFYLPEYNLLIEYDGQQHTTNKWFSLNIANKDRQKDLISFINNKKILRINYNQNILTTLLQLFYNVQRLSKEDIKLSFIRVHPSGWKSTIPYTIG